MEPLVYALGWVLGPTRNAFSSAQQLQGGQWPVPSQDDLKEAIAYQNAVLAAQDPAAYQNAVLAAQDPAAYQNAVLAAQDRERHHG